MNSLERFNLTNYCEHIKGIIKVDYALIDLEKMDESNPFEYNCQGCTVDKARCNTYHRSGMSHSLKNFGSNLYECANNQHFLALDFFAMSEPLACLLLGPFTISKTDDDECNEKLSGLVTLERLAAIREYVLDFTHLYNTSSYATPFFNISYDETPAFELSPKLESYAHYRIIDEHSLAGAITAGSTDDAITIATQLLHNIYTISDRDIYELRSRAVELLIIISRAAISAGANIPDCFSKNNSYSKLLCKSHSIEELIDYFSQAIPFYTDFLSTKDNPKHTDIITNAKDFIKQHYSEKITLLDVAEYCSISPSYLSKILRENLNCSFTEYTNLFRIENSKLMLLEGGNKIAEIAASCGFDDQSYFTKVFKKAVGMNPCKFRDCKGSFENSNS